MNERLIKERRRDTLLIFTGALLLVLLVAGLLLLPSPLAPRGAPESSPTPADRTTTAGSLPTPIRSQSLPPPIILGLTPEPDSVTVTGMVVGQIAPDFTLLTLNGDTLTLSGLRGRPVLINFWASWCAPCRIEMPTLVRVYKKYQPEGLEIVAFNVTSQDSLSNAQAFVNEFQLPFPVVLDKAGHVTADDYQLRGLPMSIFINRDGVIAHVQLGAMSEVQIEDVIEDLLAELD
ncbi:MAG: TlpA family protein disulfide reductase [Anaerolineae bacterium]|nr:TlpA family protein disulfide reductase [Anaerolineae bacterium]